MSEIKMDGKTPDIAEENIQKLKEIFPDVFTEGKVDFEKLQQDLGNYIETENERYNFTWNGKGKSLRIAQTPSTGTLRPCKAESKDWDTTENLYIEGDNLEVLKLLQKSYHGKVKMIYIDPPYNTGNDFVYKDDFTDNIKNYKVITGQVDEDGRNISSNSETNGRYHTDWLNMMHPRLRLARNLMTDDGVIFISIGNEEIENIKKICDEIFGEDNFRNLIIIRRGAKNLQVQFDSIDSLNSGYEYVLMYSKYSHIRFEKLYSEIDEKNEEIAGSWNNHWRGTDRPTMRYELFGITPEKGQWRWAKDRSYKAIENYKNMFIELENSQPTQNEIDSWYLSKTENCSKKIDLLRLSRNNKPEHYIAPSSKRILNDLWDDIKPNGSTYTSQLFSEKVFDNPKSIDLVDRLLKFVTNEDSLVLDYFSGSSTTAQALMKLNSEDNGTRKFIMVQLPEPCEEKSEACKVGYKNICEIGKERIRRAGEKIKSEKGLKAQNLDIGFKVFKLDSSNIRKWQPDYDNLENYFENHIDNYVDERTEFDVVYEIMLKCGLNLTYPIEEHAFNGQKVYSVGFGALMMCLDNNITTAVAEGMVKLKNELKPETWKVVFKDNGFKNDSNKTNIKEILKCGGLEDESFTTL